MDLKASCTFCSTECRIWAAQSQGDFGEPLTLLSHFKDEETEAQRREGLAWRQVPWCPGHLLSLQLHGLQWQVLRGVEVTDQGPASQPPPHASLGGRELLHNDTKMFCLVIMNSAVMMSHGTYRKGYKKAVTAWHQNPPPPPLIRVGWCSLLMLNDEFFRQSHISSR